MTDALNQLPAIVAELPTVPVAIALAFLFGVIARFFNLPALAGFLAAGFVLNGLGVETNTAIKQIADAGVMLLLFTIGLKLRIRTLTRPDVWGVASLHSLGTVLGFAAIIYGVARLGYGLFGALDISAALLIAFALSFSSTVFGVKVLEERGEATSLHGRTAIGILVIQDIFAVTFLTVSAVKPTSPWAFMLIGLVLLRPLLGRLLDRVGYRELLPLFGIFAAIVVGGGLFHLVGLKPDLGALVLGVMLASHKRADELADSLFNFKEILLIGFFLDIGLSGTPTLEQLAVAVVLCLLLPLQAGLFFVLFTRFKLRARSAFFASLSLSTYSEFGLIVCAISASQGWIARDWSMVLAMAVSLSFLFLAPFNAKPHRAYARLHRFLRPFERDARHQEDQPLDIGNATMAVFGMGRVGTGAYEYLRNRYGSVVIGIESDLDKVAQHQSAGRNVLHGDATDSDFWDRLGASSSNLKVVLLAMPEQSANMYAVQQMERGGYTGFIGALAKFPDHAYLLKAAGVHAVFNMYAEAGTGFAASMEQVMGEKSNQRL